MKNTTLHWLAAVWFAACTITLPLRAGADETSPTPGALSTRTETPPTKAGKRETYPFRGVVASVDTTARTVTLEGKGTRRVITVLPETRLLRGGNSAALEDVKTGEKVGGTLKKNADGRETALLLRVGDKPETGSGEGKKRAQVTSERVAGSGS